MKNNDILNLYDGLSKINLKGVKFSYGVAKNIALLKTEVESLSKAQESSKEFVEYDNARIELAKKHAKKDDKGEPVVEKNSYVIENQEAFDKEFETLKKTHKKALDERENQIKDFNDLLEKETDIQFHKIKLEDVPEDISTEQMTTIYDLIEE
jgi:hypothetical protein